MSKPKLAIFEFRMIGDAVMALPFIRSVQEQYDVSVCCTPSGQEVFRMVLPPERIFCWLPPWVDESKKYSPVKLLQQYPGNLLEVLGKLKPEIGVSSWADPRASLLMVMAGISRRIGFDLQPQNYYGHERSWRAAGLRKAQLLERVMRVLGRPLLTESLQRNEYLQHHVEDWAQLASQLGVKWRPQLPWISLPGLMLPRDLTAFIQQHQATGPVGIVHCGARTEAKRWPMAKFQQLIEEFLIVKGLAVVLIDLPEMKLPEINHPLVKIYRPKSLDEFVTLCSLSDYALCNDTGSAHLAGAVGTPVVTIFSNSWPQWFAPYGYGNLSVEGAPCPHKPCLERCVMPSYICRDGVSVGMVAEKLVRCLSNLKANC